MRKHIIPLLTLLLCVCLAQPALALTGFQFAADATPTPSPTLLLDEDYPTIMSNTVTIYPGTNEVEVTMLAGEGECDLYLVINGEVIHTTTIQAGTVITLIGFANLDLNESDEIYVDVTNPKGNTSRIELSYVDDPSGSVPTAAPNINSDASFSANTPYVDVLNRYAIGFDESSGVFSGGQLQIQGWVCHQPGTTAYFDSYDLLDASGTAVVTGYFEDGEISLYERENTDANTGGKISGSTASDAGFTFTANFGNVPDGDYTLQFYTSDSYGKAMQTASIALSIG